LTKPKAVLLAFLYSVCAIGLIVTVWSFVHELVKVDLLVGFTGLFLAIFQINLAFHVYWVQEVSNKEWEAIEEIFKTNGGKEVAKELLEHDSVSLMTIALSASSHNSIMTITTISNAINALEEKKIVTSKPCFSSGTYERVYSLNSKYKRIVKKLSFAL
jgi:DNA-binding transcriptional ArsR family regulator